MTGDVEVIKIDGVDYTVPKAVWCAMYELMAERNALQDLVMQFNRLGMMVLPTDAEIEEIKGGLH